MGAQGEQGASLHSLLCVMSPALVLHKYLLHDLVNIKGNLEGTGSLLHPLSPSDFGCEIYILKNILFFKKNFTVYAITVVPMFSPLPPPPSSPPTSIVNPYIIVHVLGSFIYVL